MKNLLTEVLYFIYLRLRYRRNRWLLNNNWFNISFIVFAFKAFARWSTHLSIQVTFTIVLKTV